MPEGTPRPFERQIHPGSGRRKALKTPKGRQLDPQAQADVQGLLGDRPRRSDLLIEHLHLIQDSFGHLSARHLRALADEMKLPMAAVYEVASFYAHFDILLEGEAPPPASMEKELSSTTTSGWRAPGARNRGPAAAATRSRRASSP